MNKRATGSQYALGGTPIVDVRIGDAFPIVEEVYRYLDQLNYLAENAEKLVSKQIEFRSNLEEETIEWRYENEDWLVLASFSELVKVDINSLEDLVQRAEQAVMAAENVASEAAASASSALASANSAAESYDAFDNRYLGSKASDPAKDNDGQTLLEGALYWNTTDKNLRVWNGTSWQANEHVEARSTIVVNSVSEMSELLGIKVGSTVQTKGYYAPGDGGGNDYEIVAAGTGNNDGGSFIDLSGSGLQAKALFPDGKFYVNQWGVVRFEDDENATNHAAFRLCIVYVQNRGGGEIVFAPGRYYLSSYGIAHEDGLTFSGYGATIFKTLNAASYGFIAGRNKLGKVGYGAGPSNMVIRGFRFEGILSNTTGKSRGVGVGLLHHSKNVNVYDCSFIGAHGTGHIFDLNGCDGVKISKCLFAGSSTTSEAIELDRSDASGSSMGDSPASYDRLHTRNVVIEDCMFIPYTVGGTTFPAPRPVGSHGARIGYRYENLVFRNNTVIDSQNNPSDASGWLHFMGAKGVLIEGNTFTHTTSHPSGETNAQFIHFRSSNFGKLENTDPATDGSLILDKAVPCENIKIVNNVFTGGAGLSSNFPALAFVGLAEENGLIHNILVSGNTFEDMYHNTSVTDSQSSDVIFARYTEGLSITGKNHFKDVRRVFDVRNSIDTDVSNNTIDGVYNFIGWSSQCVNFKFNGNIVSKWSGRLTFATRTDILTINGNSFSGDITKSNAIHLSECYTASVTGNVFQFEKLPEVAIWVVGRSNGGSLTGNVSNGAVSCISIGSNATNYVEANNVAI